MKSFSINDIRVSPEAPLFLIAGPCVIESYSLTEQIASRLVKIAQTHQIPLIFKASYDKANRNSVQSYRGVGIEQGLDILGQIKASHRLLITTDVHQVSDLEKIAPVVDLIQIPAFLCRQTDLVVEAARTQKALNIKKGQFISPSQIEALLEKAYSVGNERVLITERGTTFGYNNLVVDMRTLNFLRAKKIPAIFDATHSVQMPGTLTGEDADSGISTGGDRLAIPALARAAVAVGVSGVFFEVHSDPAQARCDRENALDFETLNTLIQSLQQIDSLVKKSA